MNKKNATKTTRYVVNGYFLTLILWWYFYEKVVDHLGVDGHLLLLYSFWPVSIYFLYLFAVSFPFDEFPSSKCELPYQIPRSKGWRARFHAFSLLIVAIVLMATPYWHRVLQEIRTEVFEIEELNEEIEAAEVRIENLEIQSARRQTTRKGTD